MSQLELIIFSAVPQEKALLADAKLASTMCAVLTLSCNAIGSAHAELLRRRQCHQHACQMFGGL